MSVATVDLLKIHQL